MSNGFFSTSVPYKTGTIVKISPHNTTTVLPFSLDFMIRHPRSYNTYTFSDILEHNHTQYILGYTPTTFFIQAISDNNHLHIPLGNFSQPRPGNHCLFIHQNFLYALIYYTGQFIPPNNRPLHTCKYNGVLFTVSLPNDLNIRIPPNIVGFQDIHLLSPSIIFGNLYFLNGTRVGQFIPNVLPLASSFSIPPHSIAATDLFHDKIVVAYKDHINSYHANTGLLLWTLPLPPTVTSLLFRHDHLYVTAVRPDGISVHITSPSGIQQAQYTILSFPPTVCHLGSWTYGYIIATNLAVYIVNYFNIIIFTLPLTGVDPQRTYHIIPPTSGDNIPLIGNNLDTLTLNDITNFTPSTIFAVSLTLASEWPLLAGIVQYTINLTSVYVVMSGEAKNSITSITSMHPFRPNHLYVIDKSGILSPFSVVSTSTRPFLITGDNPTTYTICYTSIC